MYFFRTFREVVIKSASTELRQIRSDLNESEKLAYAARKEGMISEADKLDKLAVEERNNVKKYEKRIFQKVALQAARSGFRDELYPE
jgi:DeoR/GlpR family transcriptional regulator of sugar metabolism